MGRWNWRQLGAAVVLVMIGVFAGSFIHQLGYFERQLSVRQEQTALLKPSFWDAPGFYLLPMGSLLAGFAILWLLWILMLRPMLEASERRERKSKKRPWVLDEHGRWPNGAWGMPDWSRGNPGHTRASASSLHTGNGVAAPSRSSEQPTRIGPERRAAVQPDPLEEQVTREFKSVFFNTTVKDHERIVAFWMQKRSCGRVEAMRCAIEDWRRDQR